MDDDSVETVWDLISDQMNTTLTNSHNASDAIALRYAPFAWLKSPPPPLHTHLFTLPSIHSATHSYPLIPDEKPIAPDLLVQAGEAGMDAAEFDDDVAAFLEGGVRLATFETSRYPSSTRAHPLIRTLTTSPSGTRWTPRPLRGAGPRNTLAAFTSRTW
jgi:hypothetical protein